MKKVTEHIVNWMTEYVKNSPAEGFVVGVSGGIDSALTSTLAASTGHKTVLVSLPLHQQANQLLRAGMHMEWLQSRYPNVQVLDVDLTTSFDHLMKTLSVNQFQKPKEMSQVNLKSRLRMCTLYYYASEHNLLVAGTGNKIEDFGVGFFTKYGDGGVDISPIADLFKSEVRKCAQSLGIDQAIIEAAPTDGLWGDDDRTDESQLGATYEELEWAMTTDSAKDEWTDRQKQVMEIYTRLHRATQHKINPIPVCEVPRELWN